MSSAWICAIPQCTDFIFWLDGRTSGFLYGRADYNMWLCSECVRQHWGKLQIKVLEILPEWQADLFSRHACPLERAVFLSWRSTKQVGTSYNTRYLVPGILQETSREIFSQSRRGSIVKERSFLLCLRLVFSFLFFIFSIVCLGICCVECPRGSGGRWTAITPWSPAMPFSWKVLRAIPSCIVDPRRFRQVASPPFCAFPK